MPEKYRQLRIRVPLALLHDLERDKTSSINDHVVTLLRNKRLRSRSDTAPVVANQFAFCFAAAEAITRKSAFSDPETMKLGIELTMKVVKEMEKQVKAEPNSTTARQIGERMTRLANLDDDSFANLVSMLKRGAPVSV